MTGTRFEYWVPKTSGQSLPAKTPREPSAKKLLRHHFTITAKVPFGAGGKLDRNVQIPRWEIVAAALNAGYGDRHALAAGAIPALTRPSELRRYLRHRLEMAAACIDADHGNLVAREFFEAVESSEKNAVSFIAGCLGTYVAARRWLKAAGRNMTAFLHVGLYTKAAVVSPGHFVHLTKRGSRVPDFIVQDDNGQWHAFESKGGGTSSRWKQIVSGLRQLDCLEHIYQLPHPPAAPLTSVVVQTRVDSGNRLEVTAVDPPGDRARGWSDGAGQPPVRIQLIPGVWQLLRYLESLDWFVTLDDRLELGQRYAGMHKWKIARSTAFGGFVVGIPSAWFERVPLVVARMHDYLSAAWSPDVNPIALARDLGLDGLNRRISRDLAEAKAELVQWTSTKSDAANGHGLTERGLFLDITPGEPNNPTHRAEASE